MEFESSSNRRFKLGAVATMALLVVVGVVVLVNNNNEQGQAMPLERVEAIAHAQSATVPFSQLLDESAVETPEGWVVESDEPVEGPNSEMAVEDGADEIEQDEPEHDEDIDSPEMVEEDANGEKFVADLDPEVIVTGDEEATEEGKLAVEEDGKKYKKKRRCYRNLKACGARRACNKRCFKKCRPYALRKCTFKKFCRCFCKYYGKIKKAKRCVIYKRKVCITGTIYKCKRGCKKYCKRIPRCYCCPRSHIAEKCWKSCKKYLYTAKCGYCRCKLTKCVRRCKFVCKKKYY